MVTEAQARRDEPAGSGASSRLFQKGKPAAHLPRGPAWPHPPASPCPLDREDRPAAGLVRCSFRPVIRGWAICSGCTTEKRLFAKAQVWINILNFKTLSEIPGYANGHCWATNITDWKRKSAKTLPLNYSH